MMTRKIERAIQFNTSHATLRKQLRDIVGVSCNEAGAYRVLQAGRAFGKTACHPQYLEDIAAIVLKEAPPAPQPHCGCARCLAIGSDY